MTCPTCGAALGPDGRCAGCAPAEFGAAAWAGLGVTGAAGDDTTALAPVSGAGEWSPTGAGSGEWPGRPSQAPEAAGADEVEWRGSVPAFPIDADEAASIAGPGANSWPNAGPISGPNAWQDPWQDPWPDPWQGEAQLVDRGTIGDHRMLRDADGGVWWRCGSCDTVNPIVAEACTCCSTSLFSAEHVAGPRIAGSPSTALLAALIPGGGQMYLGLRMQGAARLCLFLLVVVSSLGFPSAGAFGTIRLALFGVGLLIWLVSVYDAWVAATSGDPDRMLIKNRSLTWLTVGVLGLLVTAAMLVVVLGSFQGTPGG